MNTLLSTYDETIHEIDIDWCNGDIDTGDYTYCSDCNEWTLQEETREIDDNTQRLTTRLTCPCGAESEVI